MKINSEGELSATEEAAMGEFIHQVQRMVLTLQGAGEVKRVELQALEAEDAEEEADDLP